VLSEQPTIPDPDLIYKDLSFMTRRWGELDQPVRLEIRAFREGYQTQIGKFNPDDLSEAVDWVEDMNGRGYSLYAVRNPIRHDATGSAKDTDIAAAFYLWADCDDPAAAGNVLRFDGPKWTAAVTTGTVPETRAHTYWELQEPCTDMAAWRQMQETIAAHFGSDKTVVNPSRIMRIGGTVTYPAKHKIERGYVKEVTTIRTEYADARPRVTLEQMARVFGERTPAVAPKTALMIDTGPQAMDRERVAIQALSGQEWNSAVLRLVGSYVRKGLSDDEIHSLTDPLTLGGYTVAETRAEVQGIINRTRTNPKFEGAGQEYPAPSFDHAPAAQADAPAVEWFEDIEPSLTDAYMIKGVLAADTMSVIYGPSNSGKTFFALDLAFHIAAGREWRGMRVMPAGVLYLAAEGGRGVLNRVVAIKRETGITQAPIAVKRAGMDLLHSEADLQAVYDLAQGVRQRTPGLPLLIVIDTLSRIMAGGDENSAADMTALIRNVDAIRAATNAHVMLVHHTGKDTARGARGHSSLRAATDTEIEVQNEDGERAAQVQKQRDYQGGETFAFTLKAVKLGVDQDGDDVTSCVIEATDSDEFKAMKRAKSGRGKNQKIIMETFDQMVGEGLGQGNPGGVGMPQSGQFWAVDMHELRRLSQAKMNSDSAAKLFRTAWEGLTGSDGLFVTGNNLAWRIDRRKGQ